MTAKRRPTRPSPPNQTMRAFARKMVSLSGKRKTDVEKTGELHRFFQSVHSHAAGAEVHTLDAYFLTLLVL